MTTLPPTLPRELLAGTTFGDYRIQRLLGRGGMGAVYEAEHTADGRVVALKVLSVNLDQLDARDRFLREGRSAAAINHPNTVYVYGTEEIDGMPAISMELVADGTLEERVRARGPLPVREVVEYAGQMIEGLAAAHDVGLLHRDVKPSNCFVAADGTLKVGDFGLSKPIDAGEQLRLTQTGLFLGTPVFSSPEQLLGETLDVRSDIYAVGLTLYYALTGHLPYPGGSMMQVVASVMNGVPTPIATYRPDLAPEVAAVVTKALARKPEDRFQDYDALRAAVAALRAPTVVAAPLRARLRAWVADALIVGLVGMGVYALVQTLRGVPPWTDSNGPGSLLEVVVDLLTALAVVAVPEGLRGTSPGKWLLGLQVARPDGRRPGLPRAAARSAALWAWYPIAYVVHALTGSTGAWIAAALVYRVALLATARRANGWLTVYDRLTDTRVVQPVSEHRRRRVSTRLERPSDDALGERLGPYTLVPGGRAVDGCALGWDAALQRHAWLAVRRPGYPAIDAARRGVARVTRLRWVGSGTDGATRWDAYGVPGGEPFLRRLERPVSWEELRGWMQDLADELTAAEQDGTLPVIPPVDALWVGANDGLLIADVAAPAAGESAGGAARRPSDLVAETIARVRASGRLATPLPPFASEALDAAAAAPDPRAARAAFAATAGRPVVVSRRKRAWMLVAQAAPAPLFAALMMFTVKMAALQDREGARLETLLAYVGPDSTERAAGAAGQAYRAGTALGRAARRLGARQGARPTPSAAARDTMARNRRLAAVYIATTLADRARDTSARGGFRLLSEREHARAARIVRRHGAADPAEVRAARVLVDSVWRGIPPGAETRTRPWRFGVLSSVLLVALGAASALAVALLLRQGPIFRLFGVELVTRAGRPAGRIRVLTRQLAAWLPALVSATLWAVALTNVLEENGMASPVELAALVGVPVVWGLWVWTTLRNPARSPADRVAGTHLVPG